MALAAAAHRSAWLLNWTKNSFFFGIMLLNIATPNDL